MNISWFIRLLKKHPLYTTHLLSKKYRLFRRYDWIRQHLDQDDHVPPPLIYKLILTEGCNLRCKMCWYWGENGIYSRPNDSVNSREAFASLDFELFKDLIRQTRRTHPSFILTGGEPMTHPRFREIIQILRAEKLFATICTNGFFMDRFEDVLASNPFVDILVSLDGLESENDFLRGAGVYKKVTHNIKQIQSGKNHPHIGIQCTITPENAGRLYYFCTAMTALGVDWILLNPGWFLSLAEKEGYEKYLLRNFKISATSHLGYFKPYHLNPDIFSEEYKKIFRQRWPIQISCYFKNPSKDIYDYLSSPGQLRVEAICLKQWLRMDIVQDGSVVACGTYPDVPLGNLKEADVFQIWNSQSYVNFRRAIIKEMPPICSKCNAIYLYSEKKKIL